MGVRGIRFMRNCIVCAEFGAVGDWAVCSTCGGEPGDCAAAGVNVYRSGAEDAGALGSAAYFQPGGDCARGQAVRALSGRGRLGGDGDWRTYFTAGAGGERGRHSLYAPRRTSILPDL